MIPRATCRTALVAGLVLLAGCKKEAPPPKADKDVTGTLADEIEVDPRLVGQPSQAAANVDLAPGQRSPAAIAAAKAEAARLAGGPVGALPPLVEDEASRQVIAEAGARLSGGSSDCAAKVASGKAWAQRLPRALAVYPRGHLVEAAGVDGRGCSLRVVSFVTPVGLDDVLGYYHARVRAEGLSAAQRRDGKDRVLGGTSAVRSYLIYGRTLANGLTEIDILASGG